MGFKEGFFKVYEGAKEGVSDLADSVKTEYAKSKLKNELKDLFETLGKVRYAEIYEGADGVDESVKLCEEIDRVKAELAAYEPQKQGKTKSADRCKSCKKKVPKDVTYCPYCGTKNNEKE